MIKGASCKWRISLTCQTTPCVFACRKEMSLLQKSRQWATFYRSRILQETFTLQSSGHSKCYFLFQITFPPCQLFHWISKKFPKGISLGTDLFSNIRKMSTTYFRIYKCILQTHSNHLLISNKLSWTHSQKILNSE